MPRDADARLAAHAAGHHGVFSRGEALALGVAEPTLLARLAAGRYVRLYPGTYAIAGAPLPPLAHHRAAVLAIGGEAVVSRASAAHLHGFDGWDPPDTIHLTVRVRSGYAHASLTVHRTRRLPPHHRSVRCGVPVTSPERTLCDLAATTRFTRLRAAISDCLRTGRITPESLATTAAELGRFRGKVVIRTVLCELSPHEARTRSELESLFLRLTHRAGLTPDAVNHPIRDGDGRRRYLDAVYGDQPVELDGRTTHTLILDRNDDARRTAAIVAAGWRPPLRYTWEDLVERPERVIAEIRSLTRSGVRSASISQS